MTEYTLLRFVVIMFAINVGLGMFDASVASYNPEYEGMINFNNTVAARYTTGGSLDSGFLADDEVLPESSDSVDPDTGNVFTDTFRSVRNWLNKKDSEEGLLKSLVSQPGGFMRDIGVPPMYATSFSIIWNAILIFLLVAYVRSGGAS